jgi:hypothetical protein
LRSGLVRASGKYCSEHLQKIATSDSEHDRSLSSAIRYDFRSFLRSCAGLNRSHANAHDAQRRPLICMGYGGGDGGSRMALPYIEWACRFLMLAPTVGARTARAGGSARRPWP